MEFDIRDKNLIDQLIVNSGWTGADFIRYVVNNREVVRDLIERMEKEIIERIELRSATRYWVSLMAVTLAALRITKELGFHQFDIGAVDLWAIGLLGGSSRQAKDAASGVDDVLEDMISQMVDGFVVTYQYPSTSAHSTPLVQGFYPPKRLTGRHLAELGDTYIPVKEVQQWCGEKAVNYRKFRSDCSKRGWLLSTDKRITLGAGADGVAKGPNVRCWHLHFEPDSTMLMHVDEEKGKLSVEHGDWTQDVPPNTGDNE